MAKAKCKICGTELDTKTAYKVTDKNGKNKYFCSASEFEAEEERKKKIAEDRDKVYYLICDIMGENEIISTALFKEWQVWNKVADNEKIAKYLEENKEYLTSVIGRLQSSEYARIRYLSTIIRDKIKAFVPKTVEVAPPKVAVEEHYETKYKPKTRQALLDFEEDC
jgi:YHS domain-containing protein